MGIEFDTTTPEGWQAALAALQWQLELGVTEVLFGLPDKSEAEVSAYVERLAGKLASLV